MVDQSPIESCRDKNSNPLANNDSAKEVLGNDLLRDLARVLVERVRSNTTIDWTIKETVQAKLRAIVKRTLFIFL